MKIEAKVIPYKEQRYPTCGDYWFDENNTLQVRVNEMESHHHEFLVLIHELIEEHLTRRRGLTEQDIMAFDKMWEAERLAGKHRQDDEPGDDPRAPYRREHVFAETIERMIAHQLDVDWNEYAEAVENSTSGEHPSESSIAAAHEQGS